MVISVTNLRSLIYGHIMEDMDHTATIFEHRWSKMAKTSTNPNDGRSNWRIGVHVQTLHFTATHFHCTNAKEMVPWTVRMTAVEFSKPLPTVAFPSSPLWSVTTGHKCLSLAKILRCYHHQRSCKQNGYNEDKYSEMRWNGKRDTWRWPIPVTSDGQAKYSGPLNNNQSFSLMLKT